MLIVKHHKNLRLMHDDIWSDNTQYFYQLHTLIGYIGCHDSYSHNL